MEKRSYVSTVKNYVRLNWFKLSLLGLLVFVFLRKDLSFQFHLNSPSQIEEALPPGAGKAPIEIETKKEKEQLLTQSKKVPQAKTPTQTYLSAVEIPSLFGSSNSATNKAKDLSQIDKTTQQKTCPSSEMHLQRIQCSIENELLEQLLVQTALRRLLHRIG